MQPQRVASDLRLAKELAAKLDTEKGISENPLLASGDATQQANGAAPAAMEDGSPVSGGEEAAAGTGKEEGEEESAEEQVRGRGCASLPFWLLHTVMVHLHQDAGASANKCSPIGCFALTSGYHVSVAPVV